MNIPTGEKHRILKVLSARWAVGSLKKNSIACKILGTAMAIAMTTGLAPASLAYAAESNTIEPVSQEEACDSSIETGSDIANEDQNVDETHLTQDDETIADQAKATLPDEYANLNVYSPADKDGNTVVEEASESIEDATKEFIASLGVTSNFVVYADSFTQDGHIDGNICVNNTTAKGNIGFESVKTENLSSRHYNYSIIFEDNDVRYQSLSGASIIFAGENVTVQNLNQGSIVHPDGGMTEEAIKEAAKNTFAMLIEEDAQFAEDEKESAVKQRVDRIVEEAKVESNLEIISKTADALNAAMKNAVDASKIHQSQISNLASDASSTVFCVNVKTKDICTCMNSISAIHEANARRGITTVVCIQPSDAETDLPSSISITTPLNGFGAYDKKTDLLIWNFGSFAGQLKVNAAFEGVVIAPKATVSFSEAADCRVVASSVIQNNREIHPANVAEKQLANIKGGEDEPSDGEDPKPSEPSDSRETPKDPESEESEDDNPGEDDPNQPGEDEPSDSDDSDDPQGDDPQKPGKPGDEEPGNPSEDDPDNPSTPGDDEPSNPDEGDPSEPGNDEPADPEDNEPGEDEPSSPGDGDPKPSDPGRKAGDPGRGSKEGPKPIPSQPGDNDGDDPQGDDSQQKPGDPGDEAPNDPSQPGGDDPESGDDNPDESDDDEPNGSDGNEEPGDDPQGDDPQQKPGDPSEDEPSDGKDPKPSDPGSKNSRTSYKNANGKTIIIDGSKENALAKTADDLGFVIIGLGCMAASSAFGVFSSLIHRKKAKN